MSDTKPHAYIAGSFQRVEDMFKVDLSDWTIRRSTGEPDKASRGAHGENRRPSGDPQ
jgi:hypothetical protein